MAHSQPSAPRSNLLGLVILETGGFWGKDIPGADFIGLRRQTAPLLDLGTRLSPLHAACAAHTLGHGLG